MACSTINPKWTSTGIVKQTATVLDDGSIYTPKMDNNRDFMVEVMEAETDYQKDVVDLIYRQTQRIIILVRDRLERERPLVEFEGE